MPKILIQLFVRELHLHLIGFEVRFLARPIQLASHFSTLIVNDENSRNFFILFRILQRDYVSFTKKVVSSTYADNFISICLIQKPFMDESFLTLINKISKVKINKYGDKGSPCLVPLSTLK